jgi:hypothetical protein
MMTYGDIFELMDSYEAETGDSASLEPFALWLIQNRKKSRESPS